MKSILKHTISQPFIASTALAAALHSTWTLGTLFAGVQPPAAFSFEFIGWLVPALLIAFSIDIGLLATAGEIRAGQRTKAKYLTFGVLSLSMFYLQWVYLIAHTPAVPLSAGVSPTWAGIALTLRDAAIWIIPALLPLSTLLYTASHHSANLTKPETITQETAIATNRKGQTARPTQPSAATAELPSAGNANGHEKPANVPTADNR